MAANIVDMSVGVESVIVNFNCCTSTDFFDRIYDSGSIVQCIMKILIGMEWFCKQNSKSQHKDNSCMI